MKLAEELILVAAPPPIAIVISVAAAPATSVPVAVAIPPIEEAFMLPILKLMVWFEFAPTWKLAPEKEPSRIL